MKNLLLVLLLIFATTAFDCGGSGSSGGYMDNLPVKIPTRIDYSYRTPNGVQISSVVSIPAESQTEIFTAIETGIALQLSATAIHNPHWKAAVALGDYRIIFINPDVNNIDGSPALMFDGKYQTAGTVLGFGSGKTGNFAPPAIILPHQANQNWSHLAYLRDSARHESEHFVEGSNDLFTFHYFATSGDVHPHWKLPGE